MADPIFLTLLYVHVLFVVSWLGSSLYADIILFPILPKLSAPGRTELTRLWNTQASRYGAIAGMIALVDGAVLYAYINFFNRSLATSSEGAPLIQAGAILGILVQIIAVTFGNRTLSKISEIQAKIALNSDSPTIDFSRTALDSRSAVVELGKLTARVMMARRVGTVLLVIVLGLMVVGSNI